MPEVADLAPPSTELTVVERAAVALDAPRHRTELAAMVENTKSITVVRNAAGREQAHAAYMRLKNARIAIQKVGKDARDDATKFSKAVIAEENSLVDIISAEEIRLQTLRDAWDEARAEEKRAAERVEAERRAATQAHIDEIKNFPLRALGQPAPQIDALAIDLDFLGVTEEHFGSRLDEAMALKAQALRKLAEMHDAAIEAEAAAALAAKKDEEERIERARIAEEQRAEAERLAALQREIDEKAAAARREQEERDRAAAEARAEQDRIAQERRDAEDRAAQEKRDAAQKILDEQEAELRRKREAIEAEERAAQVKADAEAAEARRIEQERLDAEAEKKRRLDQAADEARRAAEEAKHIADKKLRDASPALLLALQEIVVHVNEPANADHTLGAFARSAKMADAVRAIEAATL